MAVISPQKGERQTQQSPIHQDKLPPGFFYRSKRMEKAADSILRYEDGMLPDSQDINELTKGVVKETLAGVGQADAAVAMMTDIALGPRCRTNDTRKMQTECVKGLVEISALGVPQAQTAGDALKAAIGSYMSEGGSEWLMHNPLVDALKTAGKRGKISFAHLMAQAIDDVGAEKVGVGKTSHFFEPFVKSRSKAVRQAGLEVIEKIAHDRPKSMTGYLVSAIGSTRGRTQQRLAETLYSNRDKTDLVSGIVDWRDIAQGYIKGTKRTREITYALMDGVCERAGVNLDTLMDVWKKNCKKDRKGVIGHGIENIHTLDGLRKGGARQMHERYNIHVFARYSPYDMKAILEADEAGTVPKNPTMVVQPYSDWNGAWLDEQRKNQHLVKTFGARFYECGTKTHVKGFLAKFNERFGKIKNLILGGHGYPAGMSLGDDLMMKKENIITVKDLRGEIGHAIGDAMDGQGSIFMSSCSTGSNIRFNPIHPLSFLMELPGVAKTLSLTTGKPTTGPIIPGNMIILSSPDDQGDSTAQYNVTSRTYKDGELLAEHQPENPKRLKRSWWRWN